MGGGKKQKAPAAPDYAALQQQDAAANLKAAQYLTGANRPTQVDAFGNTLSWSQGAPVQSEAYNQAKAEYEHYIANAPLHKEWSPKLIAQDAAKLKAKMESLENKEGGAWTQTQTLSPEFKQAQQSALDAYNSAAAGAAAQGAFNAPDASFLSSYLEQLNANGNFDPNAYGAIGNFDPNAYGTIGEFDRTQGDRVAADMYESAMSRLRPEQERTQASLDLKLRQQGLQPGTEAYNRAMQNEMTAQGDVTAKLGLDSTAAGYNAARDIYAANLAGQGQRYGQGLSGYQANLAGQGQRYDQGLAGYNANLAADQAKLQSALATQQQQYNQALQNYALPMERAQAAAQLFGSAPGAQWQGFSGATGYNPADMTSAANASYQAKMGQYNAGQNKKSGLMGAGTSLGAAYLMSDVTLKENIVPISGKAALETILRLAGYTYDWKATGERDSGVIAQQVQEVLPDLVARAQNGKLAVNYTGLVALLMEAVKYLAEVRHGGV